MSALIAEAVALSPSSFHKRYRSSYETSSSLSALPILKRYRGTSELVEDTKDERSDSGTEREGLEGKGHSSEDEGPSSKDKGLSLEEEAAPEGQQQAALAEDTTVVEPLGLCYGALRCCDLALGEGSVPSTFKVGQSSRSVLEHKGAERIFVFRQPTLVIWVDPKDGRVYTDILSYVPPTDLFRHRHLLSGRLVPCQFHHHLQQFRSLEREQERATVTFSAIWRPVLALEAWAGQTNAHRAALWHAIYDIQRENQDLRRQIAEKMRERLELTDHVARIERRRESRGE
ncbi:hypothetical protein Tco_0378014 [Tanacetum coccineum]